MSRNLVGLVFILIFGFVASAQDVEIRTVPAGRGSGGPEKPSASTVRGRVFYAETSRPVRRASIMLVSERGPGEASGLTDNEGNFEIRNVAAGTYYPMVNAPGVVSPLAFIDFSKLEGGRGQREATEEAFKDFQKIIVDGVNEAYVQIPARRGAAISGRIYYDDGDPAIGVKVEILRKVDGRFIGVIPNMSAILGMFGGGASGTFQTDDRGVFRFAGLPPGEYIVKATENASHGGSADRSPGIEALIMLGGGGSFLTVYHPDVFDASAAQVIAVEYGQEMTEVNVTIPARYLFKVGGTVISRKDKTPVRAQIVLQRVEETKTFSLMSEIAKMTQNVSTGDDGGWSFKELPKGNYRLIVNPAGRPVSVEMDDDDPPTAPRVPKPSIPPAPVFAKTVREFTVEDKDLTDIKVELGFGATVSGTVSVENAINEMPRYLTIRAGNEVEELTSTTNVANYVANPSQPPKLDRDFVIENVANGKTKFDVLVADEEYYVKSMMSGTTDLLASGYELAEGEKLANVRIVLGKGLATLGGKVIGADKEPLRNQQILIVPTDPKRRVPTFKRNVRTDDEGAFEIKLAPGEYALVYVDADDLALRGEAWDKWLDTEIRRSTTVKLESGKSEKLSLTRSE